MNYPTKILISVGIIVTSAVTGCTEPEIVSQQILPISAKTQINGHLIKLEVAKTSKEIATGLMYRTTLPKNQGMLFEFKPARKVTFWMKNCKIPLDMIFLKDGIIKSISAKNPPCEKNPCPNYAPNETIDQVIELQSGRSAELNVKTGDRIKIKFLK